MAADVPHPSFEEYADESVPQAPVGSPGKEGQLELEFAADNDGRTYLVRDFARVPFHLSGTLDHDPHPNAETVFVQSPTGGVAQGDRHTIDVTVGNNGIAHVSTQSSTKVLTMERNYAAADVSLSVGPGGHLDYIPEPIILNPDARYSQEMSLDVAAGGSVVVADVVVPGRLARGERFDFERFVSRLRAWGDDDLLFEDATHLAPDDTDPTAPGVMGEYAVYGTLYVVAPGTNSTALSDTLHDRMADVETEDVRTNDDNCRAGATTLPNDAGVVVRALGHRVEPVTAALRAAWGEARHDLIDVGAPDRRKL